MFKDAIKPAYNYSHYLSQRATKMKILKRSLYSLLDNPEKLADQVNKKLMQDEIRYKETCKYLDGVFRSNHDK